MNEEQVLHQFKHIIDHVVRMAFASSPVIDRDDLTQVASLAAIHAAKRYDASAGASLRSYIAKSIRNAVYLEASHFFGPFTIKKGVLSRASKVFNMKLAGKSEAEIGDHFGIELTHVMDLLVLYQSAVQTDYVMERSLV